jgi:predicted O-methyltransferase YrrM
MKSRSDAILKSAQAQYLEHLTPARDALLARMEDFAAKNNHPIADPEVAQLLRILVRAAKPRHVLEVGTNIGYSVVVMGRELDGILETIEIDPKILATAQQFASEANLKCDVRFHRGAALEVLPTLEGPFDFVFIDCVKAEYEAYLDAVLPKMTSGAMIVCDNLLWGGKVADGVHDDSTDALRRFNQRITTDPRLTTVVLPLGDGTGISVLK